MDLPMKQRDQALRDLFLRTAQETYEVILCLDLASMICTELYPSEEGFVPQREPVSWELQQEALLSSVPPEDRKQLSDKLQQILQGFREGSRASLTFRSDLRREAGNYGWWTVLFRVIPMGGQLTAVMLCNDVTADMLDRQRLLDRSERDGLTGLCNRSKLSDYMATRYKTLSSCGVLFLDLNELKETNDHFGHDVGDRIIRLVAESLENLEEPGVTPFRYGGDEFLLIAENAGRDEMNRLINRWILRWRSLRSSSELQPSIAVGVAWGEHPVNVRLLIEKADADMYCNKHLMKTGILPELSSYNSNEVVVGLYGRMDFYEAARQLLNREAGAWAILSLSIGHFSLVNRWYGRETGDMLLGEVGNCILEFSKAHGGLGCYIGGESFAMLLPDDPALPAALDAELRGILRRYSSSVGFQLNIGVYSITDASMIIGSMLDLATEARNRISNDAAERVSYYSPEENGGTAVRRDLLVDMKLALSVGDVDNWYQPICDPETEEIIGAEALARWQHPTWGMVEPDSFLPELEGGGLTADMDRPLWERAASQLRAWIDEGRRPVPVTLNVTRTDILSLDIPAVFHHMAETNGLDRRLLQVSVSEKALEDIPDAAREALTGLREAGFPVVMDVSGNFWSLARSLRLPADVLKVDLRSLPLQGGPGDQGGDVLRTLLADAREAGIPIVIVGVETKQQVGLLRALWPDGIQGFCYHRPMPAANFAPLLKTE